MPFQLHGEHTAVQPFRRIGLIVHIAISVLPGTHLHLSQVTHVRLKCIYKGHNIEKTISSLFKVILGGEKHDISLKILHQAGFETARQAASFTKFRAPTIAPRPSLGRI